MLLKGLDGIAVTMRRDDQIIAFQAADQNARPWIYLES
jgi:3-isopropylmalate/(R)-2-methylmalate dehydratase small subunit